MMPSEKQDMLCREINKLIMDGLLKDKLPSATALAEEFEVNIRTVNKAISRLVADEILYKKRGMGAFVKAANKHKYRILVNCNGIDIKKYSYYGSIYEGVLETAAKFDCDLTVSKALDKPHEYDGIILLGQREHERYSYMLKKKIPFVVVEDNEEPEIPSVCVDVRPTVYRLIRSAIESGLTRVAYVGMTTSRQVLTDVKKFHAFQEACDDTLHTVDFSLVRHVWPNPPYAYDALSDILAKTAPPQLVFITTDFVAPGIYKALEDHGLRVPDDVQVLSCDTLDMDLSPALASVDVPKHEMGAESVRLLIELIREPAVRHMIKRRIPAGFCPAPSFKLFSKRF